MLKWWMWCEGQGAGRFVEGIDGSLAEK